MAGQTGLALIDLRDRHAGLTLHTAGKDEGARARSLSPFFLSLQPGVWCLRTQLGTE